MPTPLSLILVVAATLLLLSILASKAASRTGVPALLLFLLLGMLAGSEGPGGIEFDDHALAQRIGVVALAFILFSGGIDTRWLEARRVLSEGASLATAGVLLTAAAVGAFAHLILGFPLLEGLLLGAIVSSTDAAAVFGILRSRSVRLKGELRPLLELESGSNDPMAIFLTIALIGLLTGATEGAGGLALLFVRQMGLGALVGLGLGWLFVRLVNRARLEYEGLYPVVGVAVVLLTFGAADALGGSGFLAVYLSQASSWATANWPTAAP